MIISYTIIALGIYNLTVFIIGLIKFNENKKRKVLIGLSSIYNALIGYIDTFVFISLYGYFTNRPKGSGYEVPESEAGFNAMFGLITLIIYLGLLIPINIYMKKKSKVNLKVYLIVNSIATVLGIAIFWLFLDKSKKLF